MACSQQMANAAAFIKPAERPKVLLENRLSFAVNNVEGSDHHPLEATALSITHRLRNSQIGEIGL